MLAFFSNFVRFCITHTMATVTETQLFSDLKAQKFKPVYLVTGEMNYYIDLVSDYFEDNIVPEENWDFDRMVVYGRDVNMQQVVGLAKRYPMLSTHQLVLVKEAQDIPMKDWEPLVAYLNNPQPQTILVFCYRHKKIDGRSKVAQTIAKVGVTIEHKKLYENQLPEWILGYVTEHGYRIGQRAAMMVAEALGMDLGKIANEMQKLFILLQPGETITESHIESNIGISKDYNVFELQNAIARRDALKCNRIINYFAENPKDHSIIPMIATLYKYFVQAMIYIQLPDKTASAAASAMKVPPFAVKDYEVVAQRYSLQKLAACIGYLAEADLRSKGVGAGSTATEGEIAKELIFKIIH